MVAVRRETWRDLSELYEVLIGHLLNVESSGQGVDDKAQVFGFKDQWTALPPVYVTRGVVFGCTASSSHASPGTESTTHSTFRFAFIQPG